MKFIRRILGKEPKLTRKEQDERAAEHLRQRLARDRARIERAKRAKKNGR